MGVEDQSQEWGGYTADMHGVYPAVPLPAGYRLLDPIPSPRRALTTVGWVIVGYPGTIVTWLSIACATASPVSMVPRQD